MFGRKMTDEVMVEDQKKWPFTLEADEQGNPMYKVVHKKTKEVKLISPEEVCALVIAKLKEAAKKANDDNNGTKIKNCVVTVPAYFSNEMK